MTTPDPRTQLADLIAEKIHVEGCSCTWRFCPASAFYRNCADAVLTLFPLIEVQQHVSGPCYVARTAPQEIPEGEQP